MPDRKAGTMSIFEDRVDAGRQLGRRLWDLRGKDIVVLGLPRGGVPVAAEVAAALDAPLDVIVVRKLGLPYQPELAMGAIGEGGARVLEEHVLAQSRVGEDELLAVEDRERAVLENRVARFRKGRRRQDLTGRIAVIVDDGIATGSTARVACKIARQLGAARVVLAVPVAPADTLARLVEPDEVICLATPRQFTAVGYHYRDFSPTEDDEGVQLLDAAALGSTTPRRIRARARPRHRNRRRSRKKWRSRPTACGWRGSCTFRCRRAPSSSLRTAAAAAGTAPGTASWPGCCSTPGWGPCCWTC